MIHPAVLVLKFLINLRFKQLGDIPNSAQVYTIVYTSLFAQDMMQYIFSLHWNSTHKLIGVA